MKDSTASIRDTDVSVLVIEKWNPREILVDTDDILMMWWNVDIKFTVIGASHQIFSLEMLFHYIVMGK